MNWSSLKYDRGLDKNPPADFELPDEQTASRMGGVDRNSAVPGSNQG